MSLKNLLISATAGALTFAATKTMLCYDLFNKFIPNGQNISKDFGYALGTAIILVAAPTALVTIATYETLEHRENIRQQYNLPTLPR